MRPRTDPCSADIISPMLRGGVFVMMTFAGACTKHNPEACCTTTADCQAKGLPDGTGCQDGEACLNNTCVAPTTCQANSDCSSELPFCDADRGLCVQCVTQSDCASGAACIAGMCAACTSPDDCDSGLCNVAAGTCGRNVLDAKYVGDVCDADATSAWTVAATDSITINTSQMCDTVRQQSGGPEICVVHYASITVAAGAFVKARGGRVLAIVSDGDVSWSGTLDVSADLEPGPGGDFNISGTWPAPPEAPDTTQDAGGGGAGFATMGASGGGSGVSNGGAPVSMISGPTFMAGSRAAAELDAMNMPIPEGFGGGGVTIVSCRGAILFGGDVNASGAPGFSGHVTSGLSGYKTGGTGGGAGGNVLFQASRVELSGRFLANGGPGGGGYSMNSFANGMRPSFAAPCPAGANPGGGAGAGGTGGCGENPPTSGGTSTQPSTTTSGGGGGSVGVFRTATDGPAFITATFAQPMFSPNEMIGRR